MQQLLFNLDGAVAQTTPKFDGVEDDAAEYMLGMSFVKLWATVAKERGSPLIGINVVLQVSDNSQLRLRALQRWVSPVVDSLSGAKIENPSADQLAATTMNYLCATGNNSLPGASSFSWNWVDPQIINDSSGVVAIKRDTIARYLVDKMLPAARSSCIQQWTKVDAYKIVGGVDYSWQFYPGQEPTTTIDPIGPIVARIEYSKAARSSSRNDATYGELNITSSYSCSIVFGTVDFSCSPPKYTGGNTFTIKQNLKINVYYQWSTIQASANIFDKTLVDTYIILVDDHGNLSTTKQGEPFLIDQSEDGDRSGLFNVYMGFNDLIASAKSHSENFINAQIGQIPFNQIKNFVFPGAKVFTYKTAAFSDWQDLSCLIT